MIMSHFQSALANDAFWWMMLRLYPAWVQGQGNGWPFLTYTPPVTVTTLTSLLLLLLGEFTPKDWIFGHSVSAEQ